jgi:hypothetical protein
MKIIIIGRWPAAFIYIFMQGTLVPMVSIVCCATVSCADIAYDLPYVIIFILPARRPPAGDIRKRQTKLPFPLPHGIILLLTMILMFI